jgi:hypothetical protein
MLYGAVHEFEGCLPVHLDKRYMGISGKEIIDMSMRQSQKALRKSSDCCPTADRATTAARE